MSMNKLYWTNKCIDNGFRCPNCQNMIGDKSGQMSVDSKNHKIEPLTGQIKCVVCNTTVGYFPQKQTDIGNTIFKLGMTEKILDSVEYVTKYCLKSP